MCEGAEDCDNTICCLYICWSRGIVSLVVQCTKHFVRSMTCFVSAELCNSKNAIVRLETMVF